MGFLRFVLSTRNADSGVEDGLFVAAYDLRDNPDVSVEDRRLLREILDWFEAHVLTPKRFNRTTSKGYYRRNTRGISWYRDTAVECVSRMQELRMILESNGHRVTIIREKRVGYVVYEDDFQVVAEPFADTETGP